MKNLRKIELTVTTEDRYGTYIIGKHVSRAGAEEAATQQQNDADQWIDDEILPDIERTAGAEWDELSDEEQRDISKQAYIDRALSDIAPPSTVIEVTEYKIGDVDLSDDEVAQDIADALIDSGCSNVRYSDKTGEGKILFYLHKGDDLPRSGGGWYPMEIQDSEAMLHFFIREKIEYPDSACHARRMARKAELFAVRSEQQAEYYKQGADPIYIALRNLENARRALADAEAILAVAQENEKIEKSKMDMRIALKQDELALRCGT